MKKINAYPGINNIIYHGFAHKAILGELYL